jgi:hypothetical protein
VNGRIGLDPRQTIRLYGNWDYNTGNFWTDIDFWGVDGDSWEARRISGVKMYSILVNSLSLPERYEISECVICV